MVAAVSVH